jgi:AP-3 complex subunit beta
MAQVIARDIQGQLKLPDWGNEIPEKGVRDEPSQAGPTAVVTAGPVVAVSTAGKEEKKKEKKVWKDLDKFYASESEEEEEQEEEQEEEEEEEEEESEEEENKGSGEEDEEEEEEEGEEEEEESEEEESERDRLVRHPQPSGGWTY